MELRVLGPLQVCVNGVALPLGTRKQQTVLALLAINHARVVDMDALVDALWPDAPPASAVPNVRGYAGNLRRLFESAGSGEVRIIRQHGGYALAGAEAALDLIAFDRDIVVGDEALDRGDLATAAARFRGALRRWRGSMLAGLARGPGLAGRCAAVEEERLVVVERLGEAYLGLDQPDRAIALLREHLDAHPLRERGQATLMRVLDRTGDTAGALKAYAAARDALATELGIEPGPELRELQRVVLARDSDPGTADLGRAGHTSIETTPAKPPPRELPPVIGHFVGREREADTVSTTLASDDRRTRCRPSVVVYHGPGGSGKSALAVHVAHQINERYPDGQLYVDMLGSTPGLRPLSRVEALRRLLHGMGVREAEVPRETADGAALFRSVTVQKRLLILLDNVRDVAQVKDLLPASGESAVLITSRHPLPALDADRRVRLDGLDTADGIALMARLLPDSEIGSAAAERITELCDHLPLAIRIAAGRLAGRPDLSPADLVVSLADRRRCLDELELDGLAVRSCIGVSYEALATSDSRAARLAARAFRALGLLNVPDFGPDVVAAMLMEQNRTELRAALDDLVGAGLLDPLSGNRYRLHDLVRLVAIERAEEDDDGTRAATLHRGLAYYAASLRRAAEVLRPGRMTAVGAPPVPPGVMPQALVGAEQARAWVDTELRCLVAAVEQAGEATGELRRMVLFIGDSLWDFLYRRYAWITARRLAQLAIDLGERSDDLEMAAWGNMMAGRGDSDFGEWDSAEHCLQGALHTYRKLNNPVGAVLTLNALGVSANFRGDQDIALRHLQSCLMSVRELHVEGCEALVLNNLGTLYGAMGRWSDASAVLQKSLRERRKIGDSQSISSSLINCATVECVRGNLANALELVDESMKLGRRTGNHVAEHQSLLTRSEIGFRARQISAAMADAEAVLALGRDRHDRYTEGLALHQLAKFWTASGEEDRAARARAEARRVLATLSTRRDPFLDTLLEGAGTEESPTRQTPHPVEQKYFAP